MTRQRVLPVVRVKTATPNPHGDVWVLCADAEMTVEYRTAFRPSVGDQIAVQIETCALGAVTATSSKQASNGKETQ